MALKKVKLNSAGSRNKERHLTRVEVKEGSRKRRRREDRRLATC